MSLAPRVHAVRVVLLLLVLVSALGCGGAATYRWKDESAIGYRIGPGDKLRVGVWKHEEVSQEATVRPDGAFSLPLVGDIQAMGRSAQEIAKDIETRLAKYYTDNPPVTVQVSEVRSYKIYIVGEVQRPAEYAPAQQVTVLMGLAMAGGFTRFASPDSIIIVRRDARGERRIPFSYSAVVEKGDLQQNLVLQLGDTVIVP